MLAAALMNPDREYTLEEMLAIAATGRGNTQRQLERLLSSGVLSEGRRLGRLRRITANRQHFLHSELESIARKSFGLAATLTLMLQPYAEHIEEALVMEVPRSDVSGVLDIDLVVVGPIREPSIAIALGRIEQSHGRRIHLHVFSSIDWQQLLVRDPAVAGAARNAERISVVPSNPPSSQENGLRRGVGSPSQTSGLIHTLLGTPPH